MNLHSFWTGWSNSQRFSLLFSYWPLQNTTYRKKIMKQKILLYMFIIHLGKFKKWRLLGLFLSVFEDGGMCCIWQFGFRQCGWREDVWRSGTCLRRNVMLKVFHCIFSSILTTTWWSGCFPIPIVQMRKLRSREAGWLALQLKTKWKNWR